MQSSIPNQTATKTLSYDVAEHLRTPEEAVAYLDSWLIEASDDKAGIARALVDVARAQQVVGFGIPK